MWLLFYFNQITEFVSFDDVVSRSLSLLRRLFFKFYFEIGLYSVTFIRGQLCLFYVFPILSEHFLMRGISSPSSYLVCPGLSRCFHWSKCRRILWWSSLKKSPWMNRKFFLWLQLIDKCFADVVPWSESLRFGVQIFVVVVKAAWSTFETLVGLWLTMNVHLPEWRQRREWLM